MGSFFQSKSAQVSTTQQVECSGDHAGAKAIADQPQWHVAGDLVQNPGQLATDRAGAGCFDADIPQGTADFSRRPGKNNLHNI